jgi:hypothetical protein
MATWKKAVLGCFGIVLDVAVGLLWTLDRMLDDMCATTVTDRFASPDGRREAVLFQIDCGATTGFNSQVSMAPPSNGGGTSGGHVNSALGGMCASVPPRRLPASTTIQAGRPMATMFFGFTWRAQPQLMARAAPEPVDIEDEIRSLYDSSWALRQGLLVIESPDAELLPEEWCVPRAHLLAVSPF